MAKPTEEEINAWYKELYRAYPSDLCHGKKGNEIPIKSAMRKKITSQAKFDEIILSIKALIKYDRQDFKPDRWPLLSTFLNQEYYNRQIGSTSELKEKQKPKTCSINGCNKDVHGTNFDLCAFHIPSAHSDAIKEAWTRTGLDYKSPTFTDDCRKYCRERFNILLGRVG